MTRFAGVSLLFFITWARAQDEGESPAPEPAPAMESGPSQAEPVVAQHVALEDTGPMVNSPSPEAVAPAATEDITAPAPATSYDVTAPAADTSDVTSPGGTAPNPSSAPATSPAQDMFNLPELPQVTCTTSSGEAGQESEPATPSQVAVSILPADSGATLPQPDSVSPIDSSGPANASTMIEVPATSTTPSVLISPLPDASTPNLPTSFQFPTPTGPSVAEQNVYNEASTYDPGKEPCTDYVEEVLVNANIDLTDKEIRRLAVGGISPEENLQELVKNGDPRTTGVAGALTMDGKGESIPVSSLQRGDLIQTWKLSDADGSRDGVQGHSAVVQSYNVDGTITILSTSTQHGTRESTIDPDDYLKVYAVRPALPPSQPEATRAMPGAP